MEHGVSLEHLDFAPVPHFVKVENLYANISKYLRNENFSYRNNFRYLGTCELSKNAIVSYFKIQDKYFEIAGFSFAHQDKALMIPYVFVNEYSKMEDFNICTKLSGRYFTPFSDDLYLFDASDVPADTLFYEVCDISKAFKCNKNCKVSGMVLCNEFHENYISFLDFRNHDINSYYSNGFWFNRNKHSFSMNSNDFIKDMKRFNNWSL